MLHISGQLLLLTFLDSGNFLMLSPPFKCLCLPCLIKPSLTQLPGPSSAQAPQNSLRLRRAAIISLSPELPLLLANHVIFTLTPNCNCIVLICIPHDAARARATCTCYLIGLLTGPPSGILHSEDQIKSEVEGTEFKTFRL